VSAGGDFVLEGAMRTVVFGAPGQLGRDLCPRLPGQVVALGRAECDITDAAGVRKLLSTLRPELVINCAAYNFVDKAEIERDAALAVNAWAVHALAAVCRDLDSTLVHFSTDYVFGLEDRRRTPFAETDGPGPVSVYGLSKLAGEYLVRSTCPKHFVFRTCGLYGVWGTGGKGGNFVETMLRLAQQGKPICVVNDQHCAPSFTADIAAAAVSLIQTGKHGLYHVTSSGDCTWFEFAREIFRLANVDVNLSPITSAEFSAPARRPKYSVLSNAKLRNAGVDPPPHWTEALAAYLRERAEPKA
jgi:dTDP-4-dehydrorhamnose reductase